MALEEYKAKRDFRQTREPVAKPGKAHRRPIFVVQEHHARRLHYDLRLEADGVLKSWAVPKQPSMDPTLKRLAVEVEDHPLSYATFKGKIPEGQYGAGMVKIWDHGTYENVMASKPQQLTVSESIDAGHVEFTLHGRKLRGTFALVRMHGQPQGKKNWLLIKMKDQFARPESDGAGQPPQPMKSDSPEKPSGGRISRLTPTPPANRVGFSNLDKLMYPDAGTTKGDVLMYYARIATRLLPFLRDRPATLERLPDGLRGSNASHFWQKNTPASYPSWIPRAALPSGQGKTVNYVLVNDPEVLLYLVNQGTLTFHVWLSRMKHLDRPDFVLFDLDRGSASFDDVVAVAKELHRLLEDQDIDAYVKTSGKSGLHVLVPWHEDGGYGQARSWAESVAHNLVNTLREKATIERSKAKRGSRVYVDVMQNAKGLHVVPPYVLRAVPGAPVSTPLRWNEVTAALDPAEFTLKTIFRRLARQKRDPMANLL